MTTIFFKQKNTVSLWINRFRATNSLEINYKFCHRPRKTNAAVDQDIVERVRNEPFITVSSLTNDYDVSYSTIRRRLNEHGLYHYIPAYQTELTQEQKDRRVEFCEENYGLNWDFLVFSDEKTFRSCNDRALDVWRPPNERYNPKYVQESRRSGRISCGVWGYITRGGVGELCETTSRQNSPQYTAMLEDVYLPSMRITYGDSVDEFTFQQDNSRVHTSHFAQDWFATHPEITLLDWPARSPDLNPIENVWAKMVWRWPNGGFVNRQDILREANERWDALRSTDYITHLYDSMTKRLDEVMEYGGNWCSY